MCVDRHKVLQILINLLRNAKYAMDAQNGRDKRLVIRVGLASPDRVEDHRRATTASALPRRT